MGNPQQQTTQTTKPEAKQSDDPLANFTPDESTLWLVQQFAGLEAPLTLWMQEQYGTLVGRIASQIDVSRLSERHTIVPVFVQLREPVKDEVTGKLRPRRLRGEDRDPLTLCFGKPIACRDLCVADEDSGFTNVRTNNLTDEKGRVVKGLLAQVADVCMRPNARGKLAATVHARYRTEDHTLTLTDL